MNIVTKLAIIRNNLEVVQDEMTELQLLDEAEAIENMRSELLDIINNLK